MELAGNTVLITGGATGIGWALAEEFMDAGSEVIICGRRAQKLQEAQQKRPNIHTLAADVSSEEERLNLYKQVTKNFPNINVLINNAGIQRRLNVSAPKSNWQEEHQEIAVNFEAPVHLSSLFIPHLLKQKKPAIVNISSGLAFTPAAFAPIYSATKAAIHAFTLTLRHQLSKTSIEVIEIIPPTVNTDLGGPGLHTSGVPPKEFIHTVLNRILQGEMEVGYGFSEESRLASREKLNEIFKRINNYKE